MVCWRNHQLLSPACPYRCHSLKFTCMGFFHHRRCKLHILNNVCCVVSRCATKVTQGSGIILCARQPNQRRRYNVFEKKCNFTLVLNLPTDTYVYQVNLLTRIVTIKEAMRNTKPLPYDYITQRTSFVYRISLVPITLSVTWAPKTPKQVFQHTMLFSLQWRHNGHDSVSNHQPHDCLFNRLFRRRSKKTSKLRVTGLCEGNSPGAGEFAAQMASNAENVSIWWRHHVDALYARDYL